MPISPDRRRAATGVATIEVLVAVAVILMIGTVATLTLGSTDRREVARTAAETSLFLQETRMRALELGRPIEVIVAADQGLINAGGRVHQFPRGITVSPQEARLVIQPTGASEGLTLQIAKGTHSDAVVLDWLTGRVDIE